MKVFQQCIQDNFVFRFHKNNNKLPASTAPHSKFGPAHLKMTMVGEKVIYLEKIGFNKKKGH